MRITVPETGTATQTATPTATATPGVQASGSISLEFGSTVDLDSLQFNTANNDLAYNWLLVDEDVNKHQISTLGNTLLGLFGNSQPMINECQTAALGTSPLTVEDIDPGTYFCYRTDLGLPGWFRFDAYDPEDASVDITVLTWVLP